MKKEANKIDITGSQSSSSLQVSGVLDLQWQFNDESASINKKLEILDWTNLEALDNFQLIKENSQRQVWRFIIDEIEYYAKLYFRRDFKWRVKRRFRGPDCLKEWQVSKYAAENNLNCVKPVAYAIDNNPDGKRENSLDNILITLSIPNAIPLDDYWNNLDDLDANERWGKINILKEALASLLAKAHHVNLAHFDLHPGNLLIEPLPNDHCQVAFVDLYSIQVGKPVPQQIAVNNLAQINQWFRKHATVTQRVRFLKSYLKFRDKLAQNTSNEPFADNFKNWANALNTAAEKHRQKLLASRDRRIMRKSKYYAVCNFKNNYHAHCFLKTKHPRSYASASFMHFTKKDWNGAMGDPKSMLEKWSASSTIEKLRGANIHHETIKLGEHEIDITAKHRIAKNRLITIAHCLQRPRGIRAWKISFAMIHRDISAAFPLAVLERRIGLCTAETLFITQSVPSALSFFEVVTGLLPKLEKQKQIELKTALAGKLAKLMRKMQTNKFVHRNLKGSNILIKNAAIISEPDFEPDSLEFIITDIDSVIWKKSLSEHDILRPYRRLATMVASNPQITKTDKARFLKTCLTRIGSGKPDWKTFWKKIEQK